MEGVARGEPAIYPYSMTEGISLSFTTVGTVSLLASAVSAPLLAVSRVSGSVSKTFMSASLDRRLSVSRSGRDMRGLAAGKGPLCFLSRLFLVMIFNSPPCRWKGCCYVVVEGSDSDICEADRRRHSRRGERGDERTRSRSCFNCCSSSHCSPARSVQPFRSSLRKFNKSFQADE